MNQVYLNRKKLVIMFLVLLITLITLFNYTTLFGAKSDNYNNTKVKYNPYANAQPNQWLKGCTHCHTTNSDGENSLEEMITGFKENKFDFAFITDHGKVTGDNTLKDGLLVLKGEEMETSIEENNAFFINDTMEDSDENSAVTTIADVKKQGGFCQLNHPMRKDIDKEEILKLAEAGLWGIEMLNSGDDLVPSSTLDYILSKGIHIWSTFGADAHNVDDVNLGWIMVNSSELTVDSIKENMIAGNFYSTTGPLIDDIKVENNLIKIATNSDQSEIKWYSDGDKVVGKGDSYTIKGNEIYVRAVIGDNSKIAMTQPIFIDKENDNTNENINNETKEKSEFGNDSETTNKTDETTSKTDETTNKTDENTNKTDETTNKTDETKNTIQILTSIFENSTTDLQYTYCEDIDDGRGLTFGFAGFCSGTYDGTMFLKEYKKLNPNNILTKYIPIFEKIDDMDNHENTDGLENFGDDFASCINDSKFIEAQKNLCDRLYWNPSQDALTEIGAKYSITKGELYDSFINHGEDGAKEIIDEATSNVGGTPGEGIDEKEWLSSFLEERLKVLSEDSTWKEAVDRVHVYQKLLDENNFELTRPMTVDCYGDTFTITKYKDDVEVPEISSENETISNENHDNEAEIPKSKNDKKDTTVVNDYESSTTKNEYTDFDDFTNNKESEKTILQENNKDSTSTLIKTANDSVDINSYDNELPKTGESRNLTYLLIGVFIILIGILAMIIINKKKKHLFFHL